MNRQRLLGENSRAWTNRANYSREGSTLDRADEDSETMIRRFMPSPDKNRVFQRQIKTIYLLYAEPFLTIFMLYFNEGSTLDRAYV